MTKKEQKKIKRGTNTLIEEQSPDLRQIQVYKMPEHMNKEKRAIQINHFQTYFKSTANIYTQWPTSIIRKERGILHHDT